MVEKNKKSFVNGYFHRITFSSAATSSLKNSVLLTKLICAVLPIKLSTLLNINL